MGLEQEAAEGISLRPISAKSILLVLHGRVFYRVILLYAHRPQVESGEAPYWEYNKAKDCPYRIPWIK